MIDIKLASNSSDYQTIEILADIIWREHYIPIIGEDQVDYMLDAFQSEKAVKSQIADGFEYFLLNYKDETVGYMAIKKEENVLFLSKIYVLKPYRGKQIAKRAMAFINEKAINFNLKTIRLTVNKSNKNAIKFYSLLGFVDKGSIVIDIGKGFVMDDYCMEKSV